MGVMDLFRTPGEQRKAAEEKAVKPPRPPKAPKPEKSRQGPSAPPAAAGAAASAGLSRRRRSEQENPEEPGVKLVVTAPDGRIVEHPWEPLRAERVIGPITAGLAEIPQIGLVADEQGVLLRTISPDSASEDRLRYEIGERVCTTLVIKDWPRDNPNPGLWGAFYTELGRVMPDATLSMHHWRIGVTAATKELKAQIDKRELELKALVESVGTEDIRVYRLQEAIDAMRSSLNAVVRSQETLFHVSAYLRVCAESHEALPELVRQIEEIARTMSLSVMRSPGEQRDCYVSSMPFAADPAYYTRLRGSAAAASLLPLINRPHQERNLGKNPVVLYGVHMANMTPVLMSPWNSNETIEITTVLGRMGSGKSYWVRCHLGRLAMVGIQTITIDPLGDFVKWHQANEATIIEIAPGSKYHINPLKRGYSALHNGLEPIEEKIERLLPMFRLILGDDYDNIAAGLLQGGLRAFYERYGEQERLMADFVALLRSYNRSSAGEFSADTIAKREHLIDTLALKCLDGAYKDFFVHPTNLDIDPRNPAARRILFNLKPSGDGELMVFASFMAITMAANIAQGSMERKILLIDELHRLFLASKMAHGIEDILRSFIRIHRHWNCLGGETLVRTPGGDVPIESLAQTDARLLTEGGRWIEAPVREFGAQRLWRLELRRGSERRVVRATAEHRWFVRVGRGSIEKATAHLRTGERLASAWAPGDRPRRGDWSVVLAEPTGSIEPVYCATVPETGSFALSDGLLTGNCALTFATQWVDESSTNEAQSAILRATGTWVLLRATDAMLEQSARLIGRVADMDLMRRVLRISGASAEEQRRSAKPMIVYRMGEAVPMYSVGLDFEDKEDDKASGVRIAGAE